MSYYTNTAFEDHDAYHLGNTGAAQATNEAEQRKLDGWISIPFIAASAALSAPRRHAVSNMLS